MVRNIDDYPNDCGSLTAIVKPNSVNENLALIASTLLVISEIDLSITLDYKTQVMKATLAVLSRKKEPLEFKYRNPYQSVDAILEEFKRLIPILL